MWGSVKDETGRLLKLSEPGKRLACTMHTKRTRSFNTLVYLLSVCVSVCLTVYLSDCLSVRLSLCLNVCLSSSLCLSFFLSVCIYVFLYFCLSVCPSVCPSVGLKITKKNVTKHCKTTQNITKFKKNNVKGVF